MAMKVPAGGPHTFGAVRRSTALAADPLQYCGVEAFRARSRGWPARAGRSLPQGQEAEMRTLEVIDEIRRREQQLSVEEVLSAVALKGPAH